MGFPRTALNFPYSFHIALDGGFGGDGGGDGGKLILSVLITLRTNCLSIMLLVICTGGGFDGGGGDFGTVFSWSLALDKLLTNNQAVGTAVVDFKI